MSSKKVSKPKKKNNIIVKKTGDIPKKGGKLKEDDDIYDDEMAETEAPIDEPQETSSDDDDKLEISDEESTDDEKETKDENDMEDEEESKGKTGVNLDMGENEDDTCLYNFTRKSKGVMSETGDLSDGYFDDDIINNPNIDVPSADRITKPIMTKYERVRVLGERRKQLAQGAKPMIKEYGGLDPRQIANMELKLGVIPFIIVRTLPDGKKEQWKISELKVVN